MPVIVATGISDQSSKDFENIFRIEKDFSSGLHNKRRSRSIRSRPVDESMIGVIQAYADGAGFVGEEKSMKNKEQMLKPEQVAAVLNIARKTVVTMAREGRIPSIRLGRFYRFDSEEIDRWIQKNRCL